MESKKKVCYFRDEDRALANTQAEELGTVAEQIKLPEWYTKVAPSIADEATPYDVLLEQAAGLLDKPGEYVLVHGDAHFIANGEESKSLYLSQQGLKSSCASAAKSFGEITVSLSANRLSPSTIENMMKVARQRYAERTARDLNISNDSHNYYD